MVNEPTLIFVSIITDENTLLMTHKHKNRYRRLIDSQPDRQTDKQTNWETGTDKNTDIQKDR